jgi:hypothetical protein
LGVYKDKTGDTALRFDGLNEKAAKLQRGCGPRFDLPTQEANSSDLCRSIAAIYKAAAFFGLLPIAISCSSANFRPSSTGPQHVNERTMFAIDWLRQGVPVLREMSLESTVENAIAAAQDRAGIIRVRLQDREPDTFRVVDAGGLIVGHSSFRRAGRHS